MADSNFVDYVKILCRSGKGGRGSMHLKHVKYNYNAGPDGGDGGRGGNKDVADWVISSSVRQPIRHPVMRSPVSRWKR